MQVLEAHSNSAAVRAPAGRYYWLMCLSAGISNYVRLGGGLLAPLIAGVVYESKNGVPWNAVEVVANPNSLTNDFILVLGDDPDEQPPPALGGVGLLSVADDNGVIRPLLGQQNLTGNSAASRLIITDSYVVYDTTSGVNTSLDTAILTVANWKELFVYCSASGGAPSFQGFAVDDAGVSTAALFVGATVLFVCSWGTGGILGSPAAGVSAQLALPKRVRFTSAAIVGQTSRIMIYGRR